MARPCVQGVQVKGGRMGQDEIGAGTPPWAAGLARLRGAYAECTLRTAAREFAVFEAWCQARGARALPAGPETVAAWVDEIFPRYRTRTVQAKLECIRYVHFGNRAADPTPSEAVRLAFRRGLRTYGRPQRQAPPLTADLVQRLLAACPATSPLGRRDRVLLQLGYDTLCRRSELAALRLDDLERLADGGARIRVRRSKSDPDGRGTFAFLSPATVAEIDAWAGSAGLRDGPILRPIFKSRVGDRAMQPDSLDQRIETLARRAGLAPGQRFTCHAMRVGAAQDLAAAGRSLFQIMRAGRWRGLQAVSLYVRDAPVNVWAAGPRRIRLGGA
jgi:integrase